jgi:hypothetical protein
VIALPLSLGSDPLNFSSLTATLQHIWSATATPAATRSPRQPNHAHQDHLTLNTYAVSTAAEPWKPGIPQWGVQVYWANNGDDPQSATWSKAQRIINYIVRLKANSISISFPFSMRTINASSVSAEPATPSPARVAILIEEARRANLRVTVRPLVDEASLSPRTGQRGGIEPTDRDAWFASYQMFLTPYAQVSQEYGAASFVAGTELSSMEGDRRWDGLVAALGREFKGEIAYDAAWFDYVSRHVNMPVYHLGVDAYFPVGVPDSASVSELIAGWSSWLDRKSTGALPRILLGEVGITAQDGAYAAPGDFHVKHAYNPQVQANWYTAACTIARTRDMVGLYVWSLDFNSDPDKPAPLSASRLAFAGRQQSEDALRACFSTSYPVQQSIAGG